jgi:hypothetical protein
MIHDDLFFKEKSLRAVRSLRAWAVLMALVALFAGCSQDDDLSDQTSPEQVGEISFNIGFATPKTRVTTDQLFNSTWQAGDEIGLFAVTRAAGATNALKPTDNYFNNVKLTRQNDGSWTTTETLYFPVSGNVLDFYAYYPYRASLDNLSTAFTVQTDQSAGDGFAQSDLLLAKTTGVAPTDDAVTLTFSHVMAMVQVEIPNMPNDASAWLLNVKTSARLEWMATAATGTDTRDVRMARVSGTNLFRSLVPVQTVAIGYKLFAVEKADATVYESLRLTNALTLTQGEVTKYTMAIP